MLDSEVTIAENDEFATTAESHTGIVEWTLLEGDRHRIAVGAALGVVFLCLILYWVGLIAFVNDDSITRLAGGMIAGMLSLVTLVVSINQLILSREFKSAGEIREQLDAMMDFRQDIARATGVPATPPEPKRVLRLLVEDIELRADSLADEVEGHDDRAWRDRVEEFLEFVYAHVDDIDSTLEDSGVGPFTALAATMAFEDSRMLYGVRHLRNQTPEGASTDPFDDLLEALERFEVATEHIKTTFLQKELTRFSQLTVLYGVLAVLAAIGLGLVYADFDGATLDLAFMPYLAIALIGVVVLPMTLLGAYVLRTATVAHRTASVGPMAPEADRSDRTVPGDRRRDSRGR